MKDFTNENVSKEYSKNKNLLLIGLFAYALAIVVICWGYFKAPSDGESMKDLTLNNPVENKKAYLDVQGVSPTFYKSGTFGYYFAVDDEYFYVIKMTEQKYNEIKDASSENIKKIIGGTKSATSLSSMKSSAIKAYNTLLPEGEKKLTTSDYDNEFSSIYLDLDATTTETKDIAMVIAGLVAIFGFAFTLAGGLATRRFKKKVEKLTEEERVKIDKEMNDKDAFYYKNAHTYLTKNYIVNFSNTFEAIPYKDVIWVYKYELRQNGIKSQQNVQVMTRDGKNHAIATLTGLTKKANDVFNEILETVAERCTNALIGYTKENRAKVNELIVKPEKKKKKQ